MSRIEKDLLGEVLIDDDALYGIQSLRAKENFPIVRRGMDELFIANICKVKKAAAIVNRDSGALSKEKGDAIIKACDKVIEGGYYDEFIVDLLQGGAGTSANMNANEVIANLAIIELGGKPGDYKLVHPIDDVNMHQSTNDVIPTAARITVLDKSITLLETLEYLRDALLEKAEEYKDVNKIGRTQLQDAVPMKAGQEFRSYASMINRAIEKISVSLITMYRVNLGATAIGSGINTTKAYRENIVKVLSEVCGKELKVFEDLYDGTQNADDFASVSSEIKVCALSLSKLANDIRLLSSGPMTGIRELDLPDRQSGSSIMPGKVNPVIAEALNQAMFLVAGNDLTVMMAAEAGQLELNAFLPVLLFQLFEEIDVLNNSVRTFADNCIKGIIVIKDRCESNYERSLSVATALNPLIGYDKAAQLVKESLKSGRTIFELAKEVYGIEKEEIEKRLFPD
ncbi:MAG: aspartate ammonia-lyase [Erysipelotrichaceae bacterium]|nr:aspartate ammonia-lyase [Erysipelotrichaceae bacterium]